MQGGPTCCPRSDVTVVFSCPLGSVAIPFDGVWLASWHPALNSFPKGSTLMALRTHAKGFSILATSVKLCVAPPEACCPVQLHPLRALTAPG